MTTIVMGTVNKYKLYESVMDKFNTRNCQILYMEHLIRFIPCNSEKEIT